MWSSHRVDDHLEVLYREAYGEEDDDGQFPLSGSLDRLGVLCSLSEYLCVREMKGPGGKSGKSSGSSKKGNKRSKDKKGKKKEEEEEDDEAGADGQGGGDGGGDGEGEPLEPADLGDFGLGDTFAFGDDKTREDVHAVLNPDEYLLLTETARWRDMGAGAGD
ncbi:hypothetical protein BJ508DRAFT_366329 [Ascobolus immersus RN42]|uniref:Uncharacterized protein n=1 Tax=Ascobolus immersus RN42 TaxID=1160509 RepID=A0A3N4HMW6_ASCIM|nr:hypothetical protein BJ508DRAFT_366329 [Ascobolus immersus RN42]